MAANSSERTMSTPAAPAPPITAPNHLTSAHHFVSIKLTTRNYLFWRTQLIPFLRGQGLLSFVDGTTPCPPALVVSTPAAGTSDEATSTAANPAFSVWTQQDQSILSLLISSLSEEVMYLAVGRSTAREVWCSIETALGSSTRIRCLNLLGQFQALRQGEMSTAEYLGRAQLLVEDLAQAGRPMPLDEQNLYVFRGLRPEFRAMASSLAVSGTPITLPQLSDYLQAQTFIHSDDFLTGPGTGAPTAMVATRGRQNGGGRQNRGGGRPNQWQNRGSGRGGQGRGRGGSPRCQICRSHGHTAIYYFRRYSDQPPPPQENIAVPSDAVLHRRLRLGILTPAHPLTPLPIRP
ncbi:PREDICTED: uncharacterized protein LOC109152480 [Ipomoea nil]|uniref:uncharacterized protein LOC109152480 n=1 Tax=Ipomoea nil TaxID=35883 RepID=UPI000901A4E3|nr:PREDICTED: uncharacterized protein LOC109152480 [Ipomoea nil]